MDANIITKIVKIGSVDAVVRFKDMRLDHGFVRVTSRGLNPIKVRRVEGEKNKFEAWIKGFEPVTAPTSQGAFQAAVAAFWTEDESK